MYKTESFRKKGKEKKYMCNNNTRAEKYKIGSVKLEQ